MLEAASLATVVFAEHPRPMWVYDPQTLRFVTVNAAAIETYGYSVDEFTQMTLDDIRPNDEITHLRAIIASSNGEPRATSPWRHRVASGETIDVEILSRRIVLDGRELRIVEALDITERMRAERELRESRSRAHMLLAQIPALIWTTGLDMTYTSITGNVLAEIDPDFENATIGKPLLSVFRGRTEREAMVLGAHERACSGERVTFEGTWFKRYFEAAVEPLRERDGTIVGTIGMAIDVTARKRVANELDERRGELNKAQEIAHLGSYSAAVDNDEDTYWSPELYRILGVKPNDRNASRTLFRYDHPEDVLHVREAYDLALRELGTFELEHRIIRRDGEIRYVKEKGEFLIREGRPTRVVGTLLDITERRLAEERLAHLAQFDTLTDLPNRSLLGDRLVQALSRANRRNTHVAVLFLDVDRFKSINDSLGHLVGDELLVQLAERLSDLLREEDTIARPGGDEFVVVLNDIANEETAKELAVRIQAALARPMELRSGTQFVSCSIGIALYPTDGRTPDELLRAADAAMYKAKRRGGGNFQFYTAALHESAVRALATENALRRAIENGDLRVHYQPIRSIDMPEAPVSFEALVRWERDGALVSAADFIPVAEESGLIKAIGDFVLDTVCLQISRWLAEGRVFDRVAVNLSARQLRDRDFGERIERRIQGHGIDPRRLEFELTESTLLEGGATVLFNVDRLRGLGITFSIDDFGTGYSSLAYLKWLPIDKIKIDRSFVTDLTNDRANQAIVEAIISVGHKLGKTIVAEGIESEAELTALAALTCDHAQGYYLGRPVGAPFGG